MEKTRYQKQYYLCQELKNYWGVRATTQLKYLEELLKHDIFTDESLSTEVTDWLYDRYKQTSAIGKADVEEFEKLLAPARAAAKSIRVDCIGHAHIDMNWMWAFAGSRFYRFDDCCTK